MSLAAKRGLFFSFGAVSIAVTRPPVLVPEITSKQSASLASSPSRFCQHTRKKQNELKRRKIIRYLEITFSLTCSIHPASLFSSCCDFLPTFLLAFETLSRNEWKNKAYWSQKRWNERIVMLKCSQASKAKIIMMMMTVKLLDLYWKMIPDHKPERHMSLYLELLLQEGKDGSRNNSSNPPSINAKYGNKVSTGWRLNLTHVGHGYCCSP